MIHFLKIATKVDPIVKELATMIEGDKIDDIAKVEASEILALIIRSHGKSIQSVMAQQLQTSLMNIVKAKPQTTYLDKTQVNASVALAFLAAHSADSSEQLKMYDAFDNTLNINVSIGVKVGVLLNGACPAEKRAGLLENLEKHLLDCLKDMSGLEEADGRPSDDTAEIEDEEGRLHGAFKILGHLGDVFIRRFVTVPTDELYTLQFRAINRSGVLKEINAQKKLTIQTLYQVLFYLQSIPVKSIDGQTLDSELAEVIKQGFEFINTFYLEFDTKHDAQASVYNLLMLNYDNYLEAGDDSNIRVLTEQIAREVVNRECYKKLLPENIRMLAIELLFI